MKQQGLTALVVAGLIGAVVISGSQEAGAADRQWYVGAGAGGAETDFTESDLSSALSARGHTISNVSVDDSDMGWKLFAGVTFGPYFGAEFTYLDSGEVDASFTSSTTDVDQLLQDTAEVLPFLADGVALSAVARYDFNDRFTVFGKVGAFHWESDAIADIVSGASGTAGVGDTGTDITWGVGGELSFSERWGIRAEWEHYEAGDKDLDFFSGSVVVRFGGSQ